MGDRWRVAELEVVLSTGWKVSIALAKSILISADIEHAVHNEAVQDMFGIGALPKDLNLVTGPVQILVRSEDAADARALLSGLESHESSEIQSLPADDRPEDSEGGAFYRLVPVVTRIVIVVWLIYYGFAFASSIIGLLLF